MRSKLLKKRSKIQRRKREQISHFYDLLVLLAAWVITLRKTLFGAFAIIQDVCGSVLNRVLRSLY